MEKPSRGWNHLDSFRNDRTKESEIFCPEKSAETVDNINFLCGIREWRPKFLQIFATNKFFAVVFAMYSLIYRAINSYTIAILSTLQRRFDFSNSVIGLLTMTFSVAALLGNLFVGYIQKKNVSRPVLFFVSTQGAMIHCALNMLPYFLLGPGLHLLSVSTSNSVESDEAGSFCQESGMSECQQDSSWSQSSESTTVLMLFMTTSFLAGLSDPIKIVAGSTYIDDGSKRKNLPLYLAFLRCFDLFGPALGFLLASWSLSYYEDPEYIPDISQNDPRWIGAWWMGYPILGACMMVISVPMLLLPKYLPRYKLEIESETSTNLNPDDSSTGKIAKDFREIKASLGRMFRNPVYTSRLMYQMCTTMAHSGFKIMQPKYIEYLFRTSASKASILSGPISTLASVTGMLLESIVLRKCKPRPVVVAGYGAFVNVMKIVGYTAAMFLTCEGLIFLGTSVQSGELVLENSCNKNCSCETSSFQPVCAIDGSSVYFSPCFAGCSQVAKTNNTKLFTACSCVANSTMGNFHESIVKDGFCGKTCQNILSFVLLTTVISLVGRTSAIGDKMYDLRCIDTEDRAMAIAVSSFLRCIFVFIPQSVLFGYIFDSTCVLWKETCGSRGGCWLYDNDKLRYRFLGTIVAFYFVGVIFECLMTAYSSRVKDFYGDDKEGKACDEAAIHTLLNESALSTRL